MFRMIEEHSLCNITEPRTSPLMHSIFFSASSFTSFEFLVVQTFLSSKSNQFSLLSACPSCANKEGPFPKVSYWPMKAAVRALSPVIILTSWEDCLSSMITSLVSSLRGHSAMMNPQKIRSDSASSLVYASCSYLFNFETGL